MFDPNFIQNDFLYQYGESIFFTKDKKQFNSLHLALIYMFGSIIAFILGEIAVLAPQLSPKAQIGPSTIKKSTLALNLMIFVSISSIRLFCWTRGQMGTRKVDPAPP